VELSPFDLKTVVTNFFEHFNYLKRHYYFFRLVEYSKSLIINILLRWAKFGNIVLFRYANVVVLNLLRRFSLSAMS
jgi:hypothetical protein